MRFSGHVQGGCRGPSRGGKLFFRGIPLRGMSTDPIGDLPLVENGQAMSEASWGDLSPVQKCLPA